MRKQVSYRGLVPDDAIEREVRALAAQLEKEHPAVSSCRLTIDRTAGASTGQPGPVTVSIELAIDHERFRMERHVSDQTVEVLRQFRTALRAAVTEYVREGRACGIVYEGHNVRRSRTESARRVQRV
jgi:hypothetical protein